ncbi:DUF1206 domain-containing protein [Brachybacterium huguangmaarense]
MNRALDSAHGAAARAEDSAALRGLARAGFAMSGLVHILMGWIALRVALGGSGDSADQSGAIAQVTQAPGGRILLGVGAVAMAALALWNLLSAYLRGRRENETAKVVGTAVKLVGKGAVFGALAATAATFALGSSSSSGQQTQDAASPLLTSTIGRGLIVVAGLVVIGIGGYHVYKGVTRKFEETLQGGPGGKLATAVVVTGVAGFVAKGIALIAVGVLLAWAGIGADPEKASGLDAGLRSMAALPAGTVLLALVGIGLALYGVFSFFRARYEDLDA